MVRQLRRAERERERDLIRARAIKDDVVRLHGRHSIEYIVTVTGEKKRIVQAAIYLAIRSKEIPSLRLLKHSCWDVDDVLAMCGDAEHRTMDEYAQNYVDDIRKRVIKWGMMMAFSDKQENFLMAVADAGLRKHQRKLSRAKS